MKHPLLHNFEINLILAREIRQRKKRISAKRKLRSLFSHLKISF